MLPVGLTTNAFAALADNSVQIKAETKLRGGDRQHRRCSRAFVDGIDQFTLSWRPTLENHLEVDHDKALASI
jgi:hypothetical protein